MALLDTTNAKSVKAGGFNYINAIQYLAPAALSGRNLCPHSSAGCRDICLGWYAGYGRFSNVRDARLARARRLRDDPKGYLNELAIEIAAHQARALRKGMGLCVRLNGSSDLPWENMRLPSGAPPTPRGFTSS